MAIATVIFVIGRRFYKIVIPETNVVLNVIRAFGIGLSTKWRNWRAGKKHRYESILDPAAKRFGDSFLKDVRQLSSVLFLFLPLPVFWALYDQQGSRWTLQATQMQSFNMGFLGRFRPDQMQAINSVFVLLFIPVFEKGIYPLLKKLRIPPSPLQVRVPWHGSPWRCLPLLPRSAGDPLPPPPFCFCMRLRERGADPPSFTAYRGS